MSDEATHVFCRKCSDVQPVKWDRFHEVTLFNPRKQRVFHGFAAICEVCGFEIARIGNAQTTSRA